MYRYNNYCKSQLRKKIPKGTNFFKIYLFISMCVGFLYFIIQIYLFLVVMMMPYL